VVANAENAAAGSGITPEIYHELMAAGVDGHHPRRPRLSTAGDFSDLCRRNAGSFAGETIQRPRPGHDFAILRTRQQVGVAIFTLLGRVFMPPIDCPSMPPTACCRAACRRSRDPGRLPRRGHQRQATDGPPPGRARQRVLAPTRTCRPPTRGFCPAARRSSANVGMTGRTRAFWAVRIDRVMETTRHVPAHPLRGGRRRHATQRQHRSTWTPQTGRAPAIRRNLHRRSRGEEAGRRMMRGPKAQGGN